MADEMKDATLAAAEAVGNPKRGLVPVASGTVGASLHDQGLSGIIGSLLVWALVTYAGAHPPAGAAAPLVYGSASTLGAMLGAAIPGKYRGVIQAVAIMLGGLYGIDLGHG